MKSRTLLTSTLALLAMGTFTNSTFAHVSAGEDDPLMTALSLDKVVEVTRDVPIVLTSVADLHQAAYMGTILGLGVNTSCYLDFEGYQLEKRSSLPRGRTGLSTRAIRASQARIDIVLEELPGMTMSLKCWTGGLLLPSLRQLKSMMAEQGFKFTDTPVPLETNINPLTQLGLGRAIEITQDLPLIPAPGPEAADNQRLQWYNEIRLPHAECFLLATNMALPADSYIASGTALSAIRVSPVYNTTIGAQFRKMLIHGTENKGFSIACWVRGPTTLDSFLESASKLWFMTFTQAPSSSATPVKFQ